MTMRVHLTAILAIIFTLPCLSVADERTFDTQVKLSKPKKASKRSREGGLYHVPFRIWLPANVKTIRGVVFNPFYTKAVTQKHWQAACRQWNFGILAANFFGAKNDEIPHLINTALSNFAKKSGHKELAKAKMCLVGMSAGAGMCTRIAEHLPEQTIAMGPVCLEVGPRNEASMNIPTMTIFGERDGKQYDKLMVKLLDVRAQGGRFAIAVQWRRKHEFGQANNLLLPLFDAAIRHRLGKPGEPLKSFDEQSGWLGDLSHWREGKTLIAPYGEFKGNNAKACWFPDAKTAHAWQAFVTHQPKLKLKTPPGLGDGQPLIIRKVGEPIEVQVGGKPLNSEPIEVHSGAEKVGELRNGKLQLTFKKPGVYPVFLKSTIEGKVSRSRPNTLIVE